MALFDKKNKGLKESFSGMPSMEEAIAQGDTAQMARILKAAKPPQPAKARPSAHA